MTHRTTRRTLGTVLALPLTLALGAGVAFAQASGTDVDRPSGSPDAVATIAADGDTVPSEDGERGNPDASGDYNLEFFLDDDVICFDISVSGVSGDWESPAPTANHIHEGNIALVGPPVLAFPDPDSGSGGDFSTSGCLEDPMLDDTDVTLADIVAAPANFYVDIHTSEFPRGDIRGGFQGNVALDDGSDDDTDTATDTTAMPAEGTGPDAGFGGLAAGDESRTTALTGAALLLALAGAATASQFASRRTVAARDHA